MKTIARYCFVLGLSVVFLGCAASNPPDKGGFKSENTSSRLYAIRKAGEERDFSAVPHLIELLDSSDPAERLLTIKALEKITGERLGYSPYQTSRERQESIQRWVQAYRKKQLKPVQE